MDAQTTDAKTPGKNETDIRLDNDYFGKAEPGVSLHFYGGSRDRTNAPILTVGQYLFGRSRECDFRFSDSDRTDVVVSRKHAIVGVKRSGVVLINLTPRNGLFLNGVALVDFQEVDLNDTDVVGLGANGPHIRVRIGDLGSLRSGETRFGLKSGRHKTGGARSDGSQ